jgi:hypothetical protein
MGIYEFFQQINSSKQFLCNGKELVEPCLRCTLCLHDAVLKDNATFILLVFIRIQYLPRIPV